MRISSLGKTTGRPLEENSPPPPGRDQQHHSPLVAVPGKDAVIILHLDLGFSSHLIDLAPFVPMRLRIPLLLTLPALACGMALGDTFSVTPGQSIQDAIDNAADGDLIVIFGGSYSEELTINKAVQLTEAVGEDVIISGNVTITGVSDAPPFRGFNLGAGTTTLTVENTTGLAISGVTMDDLLQLGGSIYVSDSTINGGWSVDAYSFPNPDYNPQLSPNHRDNIGKARFLYSEAERAVGFRLNIAEGCTWSSLKKGWLGYSTLAGPFQHSNPEDPDLTNALTVLVANEIAITTDLRGAININHRTNAGSSAQIYNNYLRSKIQRVSPTQASPFGQHESIRATAGSLTIQNNYSELMLAGNPSLLQRGDAVTRGYAAYHLSGDAITVRNNVIKGNVVAINAPGNSVIEYNYAANDYHYDRLNADLGFPLTGDCVPTFAPDGNGGLVDTNTGKAPGASDLIFLKDSGWWAYQGAAEDVEALSSPNSLYNDRDDSRNNLGPSGGPSFDPEAWTTSKPVVISFDLSPESQVAGQGAEVLLSNGIAISAP